MTSMYRSFISCTTIAPDCGKTQKEITIVGLLKENCLLGPLTRF